MHDVGEDDGQDREGIVWDQSRQRVHVDGERQCVYTVVVGPRWARRASCWLVCRDLFGPAFGLRDRGHDGDAEDPWLSRSPGS